MRPIGPITSGDLIGLLSVYLYVGALLLISRKRFEERPFLGRKFLHLMAGNIIFLLPLFETKIAMVLLAAFPFVILTFLISSRSPFDIVDPLTEKGHGMGLFYYAVAWTILAFFFFQRAEIIAIGIAAMSYGDGTAGFIGQRFGKHEYSFRGSKKSLEGSLAMMATTTLSIPLVLLYFNAALPSWYLMLIVAFFATAAEALVGRGYDNLTIALITAIIYYTTVHSVI
ncbi:MAG: diacylglycerol/polyprenol kinase family protein [Candidatus Natronoplasma sp.]